MVHSMTGVRVQQSEHKPRRAITIRDVAAIAGVSPATVSRVINGTAGVSPQRQAKVLDAIERTGFQVSMSAQRLATGRAESIAVVLTEPVDELLADPTYASVFRGILDGLTPTPYTPLLLMASTPAEQRKTTRLLSQGVADAIIHLSPYTVDSLLQEVSLQGTPLVLCGRPEKTNGLGPHSMVYSDDVRSARAAGRYLKANGMNNVLALMGPKNNPASRDRYLGYSSALGQGLGGITYVADWSEEAGYREMARLLADGSRWDAVAAGNDRIAIGAIQALQEIGLNVPGDVRVVGFDDHAVAEDASVPLTTVRHPFREEGRVAVELALEAADGSAPRIIELPTELVVRESA